MTRDRIRPWVLWMLLILAACGQDEAVEGEAAAAPAASAQALIIDVRTQQEYDSGHVRGAVLIPYDVIADRIGDVTTDQQQPIILYCRSGRRAGIAQRTLQELGFRHVENAGGLDEARQRLEP